MTAPHASNQTTTTLVIIAAVVGAYLGWAFIPMYSDNYSLKQLARSYAAEARHPEQEEKAKARFMGEAQAITGTPWDEMMFTLARSATKGTVTVNYKRDLEFPLIGYKKTYRFKWQASIKYN